MARTAGTTHASVAVLLEVEAQLGVGFFLRRSRAVAGVETKDAFDESVRSDARPLPVSR